MKKLFLFGFVLALLFAWTVAGAYTGTKSDVKSEKPNISRQSVQGNSADQARELSVSDIGSSDKIPAAGPGDKPDQNVILQGGDNCSDPTVIVDLPYTDFGTTEGYTDDYNEVCPFAPTGGRDVVYEFTAPVDLTVSISLCGDGTYYDTKVYVYENICPDAGNPIACNDDACENDHQSYLSELVSIPFTAGNTYYIVVDGYSAADFGEYELHVTGYSELGQCPDSPNPSIFTQSYLTGVNGVNSDIDGGYTVFDNYRTSGTINSVHWWGIKYFFNGSQWVPCAEDPQSFTVAFWNDDGTGLPDVTSPVYTETFVIAGDDTGDDFGTGGAPIYRYSATLTTPVTLDEGWVSIQGNPGGDPDCWFLWHSSTDGDSRAVQREDDSGNLNQTTYDLSICLNGTYQSLTGSCCDDLTGTCDDNVQVIECPIANRFTAGVLCADLDPPCGPQAGAGACCVDGDCTSPVEESDCDALGGFFYGNADCGTFTCPADVVYHKDFDGNTGMGDWSGDWALTGLDYNSPPNSLTDSPGGNYPDDATLVVTLNHDIPLTGYFGYTLEFMTKFKIETGFDYCYLDVSTNGGASWINIYVFNGENPSYYLWHLFTADLGGFSEQSIRLRFRLITDGAYNVDGMYVDDMFIYGEATDTSPPLIQHVGPTTYASVPDEYDAVATITDLSGISEATLTYAVDEGASNSIGPDQVNGDEYTFIIPAQEPGAHVVYSISATDNNDNTGTTPNYHYVSGTVVYYDDDDPEYIFTYAAGNKIATRFTPEQPAVLVTGMFRLYQDVNTPPDTVDVEVWSNGVGDLPNQSLNGPRAVFPQSDLDHPEAFTYVDYRGMGMDFAAGENFHLGYTYRSTRPPILYDSPAVANRSSSNTGGGWAAFAGGDYHIRAIVAYNYGACCNEETQDCFESYAADCTDPSYTFFLGQTCDEACGGGAPCGPYVVGDYNGSGAANVADVVDMFSKLKTGNPSYPGLDCECPPGGGNSWPVRADVNASCTFNVADVVALFSYLKTGSPALLPCGDCPPGSPRIGGNEPLVRPALESKAKIGTQQGAE